MGETELFSISRNLDLTLSQRFDLPALTTLRLRDLAAFALIHLALRPTPQPVLCGKPNLGDAGEVLERVIREVRKQRRARYKAGPGEQERVSIGRGLGDEIARRHHMTVAEWVRKALRVARRAEPSRDADRKVAVVRAAARHEFPTSDIRQMLAEIERGYGDAARI